MWEEERMEGGRKTRGMKRTMGKDTENCGRIKKKSFPCVF